MAAKPAPGRVVICGKPDCHLCDLAYQLVLGLQARHPLIVEKVDITRDPRLWEAYHEKIPVLYINDRTLLTPPIHARDIEHALSRNREL